MHVMKGGWILHQIHHASLNLILSLPALNLCPLCQSHLYTDPPSLALSSSKPPCLLLASRICPIYTHLPSYPLPIKNRLPLLCLLLLPPSPTPPTIPTLQLSSFLILNSCPILSSTLFSTFHLTDLTPNLVLTSIMFSYLAWISFNGSHSHYSKYAKNIYLPISATYTKSSSITP